MSNNSNSTVDEPDFYVFVSPLPTPFLHPDDSRGQYVPVSVYGTTYRTLEVSFQQQFCSNKRLVILFDDVVMCREEDDNTLIFEDCEFILYMNRTEIIISEVIDGHDEAKAAIYRYLHTQSYQ